jgi:UDP-N-acetylglucosamine transferase subunit ALG13
LPAKSSKCILVAPLDWGLGHTTRCIPIIRHLLAQGHRVLVAGNDTQHGLLSAVLSGFEWLPLRGYEVRYARSSHAFMPRLLAQVPRIRRRIAGEHAWLQQQVAGGKIDAVISDNRYGLYSAEVPCIIMTHQLQVLSGMGALADQVVRQLHYKFLEKFEACWIVDKPADGLSGKLAHPGQLPEMACHYIGLLSGCAGGATEQAATANPYLLVLLSGTEPQRSILQSLLWQQCLEYKEPVVFVAGSTQADIPDDIPSHIRFVQRVAGKELQQLIAGASLVLCRSGYSSVMDLAALQKPAVLIPTPGQTEQEYLARHLQEQGLFPTAAQSNFVLEEAMHAHSRLAYRQAASAEDFALYRPVLDRFIEGL